MASCPNCGRQTLRTKDWACQWCGYPLISRAFKKIDKTFKELQEERSLGSMTVDSDVDIEPQYTSGQETEGPLDIETGPPPPPKQEPKRRFSLFGKRQTPAPRETDSATRPEPPRQPSQRPVDRPAPGLEPPPDDAQKTRPPLERVPVPETPPGPETPTESVAEPDEAKILPGPEKAPESIQSPATPPPVDVPGPEPEPEEAYPPPPAPEPPAAKPEITIERQPPVSSVKLDDIKDGMEISIDDLDALFRADKAGTNLKLNGKSLVLKGVVEKVFIKEHLEIRYIVVKGTGRMVWSARCAFEKENAGKASRLTEGSAVAVRGKYDGYGKNVIFKNCEVV